MNPDQVQQNRLNPTATTLKLPAEGQVFRATGDNMGSTLYMVKDGQLVSVAAPKYKANTTFEVNGKVYKAGDMLDFNPRDVKWLDPSFRGAAVTTISASDVYNQQNGPNAYNGLPTFNVGDIETAIKQGHTFNGGGLTINTQKNTLGAPLTPDQLAPKGPVQQTVNPGQTNSDIQNLVNDPTLSTSGSFARVANGSIIDTRTGQVVSDGKSFSSAPQGMDDALAAILNNPNLSGDQKKLIQSLYGAISTNDQATADRLKASIQAATQYSDPFFKSQTALAMDALDRAFQAVDGDLAYSENKLRTSLDRLRQDIEASKDTLSFEEQTQLKELERHYMNQLEATQDDLASRGFTTSSIRSKSESMLNDTFGDMRESTRRSFRSQNATLDNQLSRSNTDTTSEINRLRELAARGKLDQLRSTEEKVGSSALSSRGYGNTLGGVGGSIPRAQALDALSFGSNFVF